MQGSRQANVDVVCHPVQVYEEDDEQAVILRLETVPPGPVLQLACPVGLALAVFRRWLDSTNRLWQLIPGKYSHAAFSAELTYRKHALPERRQVLAQPITPLGASDWHTERV